MARKSHTDGNTSSEQPELVDGVEAVAGGSVEAAEPVKSQDERFKKITLDADSIDFAYGEFSDYVVSDVVNRIDFIRAAWGLTKSRGDITRELTRLTGKKVAYQIVFAATKNQPGGPVKVAEVAEVAAPE